MPRARIIVAIFRISNSLRVLHQPDIPISSAELMYLQTAYKFETDQRSTFIKAI
jgi:hypothetical protein